MLRPAIANSPLSFGRRGAELPAVDAQARAGAGDDLRLFVNCFAVGFVFVSVLIF